MATAPSPNDLTRQQLDELDALLQRMLSIPLNPSEPAPAPPPPPPAPVAATVAPAAKTTPSPNWRVDSPPPATGPAPHVISMPTSAPPETPPMPEPPQVRAPLRPEPERFVPPSPSMRGVPETMLPDPPLPDPIPAEPIPVMADRPATIPFQPPGSIEARIEMRPAPSEPDPAPFAFPFQAASSFASSLPPLPGPVPSLPVSETVRPAPSRRPVSPVLWPFVALNYVVDGCLNLTGFPGRLITSRPMKTLMGLTGVGLIAYTLAYLGQQQGLLSLPQPLPWPK